MRKPSDSALEALAARLGHDFRDLSLLRLALTHASARVRDGAAIDNERLEFMGDRVLGLAAAELLYSRYPGAAEGELARRLNQLVRAETCAEVAKRWELGPLVLMSGGEAESGGREKRTILADACEAVLGAVFADGGFDAARIVVHRFWTTDVMATMVTPIDAKTALQEWAQARQRALPRYVSVGRSGPDHAPLFTIEVQVDGMEPARGEGASKRAAEQAAAASMLAREGVSPELLDG